MSNEQRLSIIPGRAVSDERLSDSELRTLTAVAIYSDKDGWCWPSQTTLAKLRSVSRRTIVSHIARLKELGYLEIVAREREDGGRSTNMMRVKLDLPPVKPGLHRGSETQGSQGHVIPEDHIERPNKERPIVTKESAPSAPPPEPPKKTELPEIPEPLASSSAFVSAWADWQAHRREIKKVLTPRAAELQLKDCLKLGEARAVAAIRHSIKNSYTGLYEAKANGKAPSSVPQAAPKGQAKAQAISQRDLDKIERLWGHVGD